MLKIKITIDTKEDSHEEIRKVIKMLSNLVGDEKIYSNKNIFDEAKPEIGVPSSSGNVFGNMFNDNDDKIENSPSAEDKPQKIQIIEY